MKNLGMVLLAIVVICLSSCVEDIQQSQGGLVKADELLIADFEGADYGGWEATGDAFGTSPRWRETEYMKEIRGFEGKGLATSYQAGGGPRGTLTSPEFTIDRDHIVFLISGGENKRRTSMNLLVDGKVVRRVAGRENNTLDWENWDVSEFKGKTARIKIIDSRGGEWGYISVDHIYQSDVPRRYAEKSRKFHIDSKYINFPVDNKARQRLISVIIDGKKVREFTISLAAGEPDYWVFLEVGEFEGKDATVRIDRYDPEQGKGFDSIFQADTFPGEDEVYTEKLRPQFHFTSKRGWNNDTNGMVYYDGEYHMFYQHNPFGWPWGNMTWGHAVSTDMIHWKELGDAIHPDELGTIFSGGAVVDHKNTSGFQTGDEKPIVCFYTSAGGASAWSENEPFTQSLAYSNDRGRTFTKYEGNPIIGHIRGGNRDPKVIWHEPTGKWVMVLFVEESEMDFFTSDDLKTWTKTSRLKSFHECPELFELPVDGDQNNKKWVLYGAPGDYFVGEFDGKKFKPESEEIKFNYGNCFYASQTFSDIPEHDGRRIQMAWGPMDMKGMPFNQMILFPVRLTLKTTDEGIRMFATPVKELLKLRGKRDHYRGNVLESGDVLVSKLKGDLFDIRSRFAVDDAKEIGFVIRGIPIVYNVEEQRLSCGDSQAKLAPINGRISLTILVDRTSLEIFGNGGRIYMPMSMFPDENNKTLEVYSQGGKAQIGHLRIYALNSIWR
ncbi:MAG: GH32 C-terminal domain-containing protein [Planctomycetota bacterium]